MVNVESICKAAKNASYELSSKDASLKRKLLNSIADSICEKADRILAANKIDVQAASADTAFMDRLLLDSNRILKMADGVREVAKLADPIGEITEVWTTPTGLIINKVRAPLGVISVIYEARPNVTADVVALCLMSGNAIVLRGGKEAINSNRSIYEAIIEGMKDCKSLISAVAFIDDITRESTAELLKMDKYIDVIIPRGGEQLKKYIIDNSKIPVIASAGGVCHTYVEKSADIDMAISVVKNAKLSRPSVCNATETLLVDKEIASILLPRLLGEMYMEKGVKVNGCPITCDIYPNAKLADSDTYDTEYHDYEISVRVVEGLDMAIEHINKHGTRHSEAIITNNDEAATKFCKYIDAAAVYVNASTRFTDGYEFGFGAEIAISTQKLHARGPLGLKQLTSEKYIIKGNGTIRV